MRGDVIHVAAGQEVHAAHRLERARDAELGGVARAPHPLAPALAHAFAPLTAIAIC